MKGLKIFLFSQICPDMNQTAQAIAKALNDNFFLHYGDLCSIHCDQAANFKSKLIQIPCSMTWIGKPVQRHIT